MSIVDIIYYFDLLQDKSGSPYFNASEKEALLNRAQYKVVLDYAFGDELEDDVYHVEQISSLILEDLPITSSASGIITQTNIDDAINTETSDGKSYIRVLSIAKDEGSSVIYPVKIVTHNDKYKFKNNSFKQSSSEHPQARISRNRISLDPIGVENYLVTLIKEPVDIVYDESTPANNVELEVPNNLHDIVLAVALDDAGVASRDEALTSIRQLTRRNLTINDEE